ncbi:hypothetical protein ACIHFD_34825 [Nonomuraea sp. NPDC051941]|uniref:hypothetical protein n=1 Tax=Nonomuraea sp. NPDC051941 TaxID=3364373 RepID=UPI0037CAB6FD
MATTRHHFSVATAVGLATAATNINGYSGFMEWEAIDDVASHRRIVAPGFAEERPGAGILSPPMTATQDYPKTSISGVTGPCSLARSMNLLAVRDGPPRGGHGR